MKLQAPNSKLQKSSRQPEEHDVHAASPVELDCGLALGSALSLNCFAKRRERRAPAAGRKFGAWCWDVLWSLELGGWNFRRNPQHAPITLPRRHAFTLIEIMIVVAIIGLIMALGAPSLYKMMKREGMRKAVDDLEQACQSARGKAIISGQIVMLEFRPREQHFQVVGGGGGAPAPAAAVDHGFEAPPSPTQPTGGLISNGTLPVGITFEMLNINLLSFRESDFARVRFFPNGTCDEVRLVMVGPGDEWRGIELENTTGVPTVVTDMNELRTWGDQ